MLAYFFESILAIYFINALFYKRTMKYLTMQSLHTQSSCAGKPSIGIE